MAIALLLGKPLHGETRQLEGLLPTRLDEVVEVIPDKRYATGYGGTSVGGRSVRTVPYYRVRLFNAPATAIVYPRRNYIPQEEDEELVLRTFSS